MITRQSQGQQTTCKKKQLAVAKTEARREARKQSEGKGKDNARAQGEGEEAGK